jgi:PKD repeat protein
MKNLTILIALFVALVAQSQGEPCAFDWTAKTKFTQSVENTIQEGVKRIQLDKSSHTHKIIPVVVHVVHLGGSENISDAQIQSQIDVLNEDFGKLPGTPGDGNGVDTEVRFCLAKKGPNGNCTNGIVRINSSLTNHKTYDRPLLKELSFWDNERYLNIYIVKTITGNVAGYSSFPGGPADEDGVVVLHNVFGTIGTASSSMGRTGTHELGHWIGLFHTFNGGCGTDVCLDGDNVCDTPPVNTANYNCPTGVNTCANDNPDLPDLIANYMDYTSDACKNMLTQGQKDRLQSVLVNIRSAIWTDTNLVFTGCDTNYVAPPTCGAVANLVTLTNDICIGNDVSFVDVSLNNATSWTWYFPGGNPTTSNAQNPTVNYPGLGSYDVKLVVSDGSISDSITKPDYITVSNPGVGDPIPYSESFESGFPNNGLSIMNADGLGTWGLDSAASVHGNYSIKIDNYNNPCCGSIDEIIFPYFDLSSLGTTPYMKFVWAYAKSDDLYSDELIVQLSSDCGNTWSQVYYRTGNALATGPTQTTPFIPTASQWKNAVINLTQYSSKQYVLLKIVNVPDGGNNLYIDNINIGSTFAGVEEIDSQQSTWEIFPNPASNVVTIKTETKTSGNLRIINLVGKVVKESLFSNQEELTIDVDDFPAGIYQVKLSTSSAVQTKSLVIY